MVKKINDTVLMTILKDNELTGSSVVLEITELHHKITSAIKNTLQDAIRIGELLKEQKDKLPHGAFTSWIKANLPFTDRTARNYMKVFDNREQLKAESVSVLSGAYKMLSTPKETAQDEAFAAGLQKHIAEGLRLDDALKLAEWDVKYDLLNKKLVALETEWETLKDSNKICEIADFYHRAHAAEHEATSITLDAEMNLGRVLNEVEERSPEEYRKMTR